MDFGCIFLFSLNRERILKMEQVSPLCLTASSAEVKNKEGFCKGPLKSSFYKEVEAVK